MRSLFLIFALFTAVSFSQTGGEKDTITLQLKWTHQFQFAGYYAAIEKGYYESEGFSVRVREGTPTIDVVEEVVQGRADFGIGNSDLLIDRSKGKPIVVLAAMYQHSPLIFLAREEIGINSVSDFAGKKIMFEKGANELLAYLRFEQVPETSYTSIPYTSLEDFIAGKADIISAYLTDEIYVMQQRNLDYDIFNPTSDDIDFYAECLFTSESEIDNNHDRVERFRQASLKGWKYAVEHPEEIVDLILAKYSQKKTRGQLLFEANESIKLMNTHIAEIGYMHRERWESIAEELAGLGIIPEAYSVDGLLYTPPKESSLRWLLYVLYVIVFLGVIFAVIFFRTKQINRQLQATIKQLKEVEAELKENKRSVDTLLSNLPGMAYRCMNDKDWTMNYISQGCYALTGYKPEQMLNNKELSYNDIVLKEYQIPLWNTWQTVLAERDFFTGEYPIITASGETKWVWEKGCGVFSDSGELICLEGFIADITDIKLVREQLSDYAKQLEETNGQLKRFISILAHDLKSPFQALIGLAEVLEEECNDLTPEEISEMHAKFKNQLQNLLQLINNLLEWGMLKQGLAEFNKVTFDICKTVNFTKTILEPAAGHKKITLRTDIPKECIVTADENMIGRILQNLASNAIKFTKEGGTIHITAERKENSFEVSVSDTGIGMPSDMVAQLFDIDKKNVRKGTSGEKGTGLGLLLCKEMVECHTGTLSVTSEPDKGTTFRFVIPQ